MKLLAIDTSTEIATVALLAAGSVYTETQAGMRQHAQYILPMIDRVLAQAGMVLSALDGIAYGRGPGSFTGLRIACSVAKGLAYAHGLPLFPVSGLAAIANEVYHTQSLCMLDSPVLAMIDARMHQVYWGYFFGESYDVLEQVSDASDIIWPISKPVILAGVGIDLYRPDFSLEMTQCVAQSIEIAPTAIAMIRLVDEGHVRAVTVAEALPVYVRNHVTHGPLTGVSGG